MRKILLEMAILIVDDDLITQELFKGILEKQGYNKIQVSTSGEHALELIKKDPPDLILLDVFMPGIEGYEVCERLKADNTTTHIPIIMVTGGAVQADEAIQKSFKAGAIDFITKPIRVIEFLARINSGLTIKKNHDLLVNEIEKRKQAEKTLQKSEQRYRRLSENSPDMIYRMSLPDGKYDYVSPAAKKVFGYPPEAYYKNPLLIRDIIHPDFHSYFAKQWKNLINGFVSPVYEYKIVHKDKSERWINQRNVLVKNDHGQPIALEGVVTDITDQKKIQEEILKARKLESIGKLASGIAHDFNNLLYVAMGNISLAQDDLKSKTEASASLKAAEEACIKAKELTARLITFSKGGDPVKKKIPIDDLLKNTVISALKGFNIKSKISIPEAIRQFNIDEDQIKQVFNNIVVNAREAMDDNEQLTVSCENIDIAENSYLTLSQGEYIKISFEDQGCGISKETLEKIFRLKTNLGFIRKSIWPLKEMMLFLNKTESPLVEPKTIDFLKDLNDLTLQALEAVDVY
jgi:PAS domain S-box-containing protein